MRAPTADGRGDDAAREGGPRTWSDERSRSAKGVSTMALPGSRFGLPRHHDLGCLHDRERIVAPAQLQFLDRVARDDGGQHLVADAEAHLREQPLDADLVDVAPQLVTAADRDNRDGPRLRG